MTIGLTWAHVPTLTRAHACMHVTHTLHLKSILKIKRVQGYSGLHNKLLSPKTKTSLYLLLTICAVFLFSTEESQIGRGEERGKDGIERWIPVLRYLAHM